MQRSSPALPGPPGSGEASTYQAEDGVIMAWDAGRRVWVPQADEELVMLQQKAYVAEKPRAQGGQKGETGRTAPSSEKASDPDAVDGAPQSKDATAAAKKRKRRRSKKREWINDAKNSSVYVRGLPEDVTVEEILEVFHTYGVIRKDDGENYRIKIYRDENGVAKGDGVVTYLRDEAADNALLLDGSLFRPSHRISVEKASFEQKGDFVAKARGKRRRQAADPQFDLLSWDEHAERLQAIVVLANLFSPEESLVVNFAEDLKDEVKTECERFGAVDAVTVFETNPDGVVVVKFFDADDAADCLKMLHGRYFGGRQISASFYDGVTDYKVKESDEIAEKRAKLFGDWLRQ